MKAHNYAALPSHLEPGFRRYVEQHVQPGDFIMACLKNDLCRAVLLADPESLSALPTIMRWLYNDVPSMAWGSSSKVSAWLRKEAA